MADHHSCHQCDTPASNIRLRGLYAKLRKIALDCQGMSIIASALALPVLVGIVGLAVDVGVWQMNKRSLQGAVDQAAYSTAIASGAGAADVQAKIEGRSLLAVSGIIDGVDGASVVITNPPSQGSFVADTGAWEVRASRPQDLFFSAMFMDGTPMIAARAVAREDSEEGKGCILSLHPSANGAVKFENNADIIDENCDVYINSNHARAFWCTNNCDIASSTFTVGGNYVRNNGSLNGPVHETGVAAAANPYADIPDPGDPACTVTPTVTTQGNQHLTINPGVYCGGIDIQNQSTLTMTPGIYYIKRKFNLSNNVTVNATGGVTIILIGNYCIGDGSCDINKGLGNNVEFNLEAPTTGPYAGIALYAPGSATSPKVQQFSNNISMNFQGVIYAPNDRVWIHNNAQFSNMLCAQVVSKLVHFENNADMGTNCEDTGVEPIGGSGARTVIVE